MKSLDFYQIRFGCGLCVVRVFSPIKLEMQCITGKTICCSFSEAAERHKNLTSEVEWTIDSSNSEAMCHVFLLEILTICRLLQIIKSARIEFDT